MYVARVSTVNPNNWFCARKFTLNHAFSLFLSSVIFLLGWTTSPPASAFDSANVAQLLAGNDCVACDLSGADLNGVDLRGRNLAASDLSRATLEGTDLRAANLSGASLFGVDLFSTHLSGADLRGANLQHLDADIDLEHIDLIGVLLEGARFGSDVICGPPPKRGGWGCASLGH